MELRTRDLGEIFDRAVALYGQKFLVLIALVAVATIPLAVLQYPIAQIDQPQLDAMLRLIEHPELARTQPVPPLFASPRFLAATVSLALAGCLVWAFSAQCDRSGRRAYLHRRAHRLRGVLEPRCPPLPSDRGSAYPRIARADRLRRRGHRRDGGRGVVGGRSGRAAGSDRRILIVRFLERRAELSPRYREALAAQLAAPVRPRVPPELQRLDDESLLERL
jgi:hypothetical protein